MRLRPARPEDVPAVARIAAASYAIAFRDILGRRALDKRDAAFFRRRMRRARRRLRLATSGGRVLGFSLVVRRHLDMLFVDPRFTGRRVGSRLLAECERRGVRTLECFRDNRAARRFYERAGWRAARQYERALAGQPCVFVLYERSRR